MAWFQGLAGRAEDFLNKIDQNAATVLNDTNKIDEEKILSELPNEEQVPEAPQLVHKSGLKLSITPIIKNPNIEPSADDQNESSGSPTKIQNERRLSTGDEVSERGFNSESPFSKSSSHNSLDNAEDMQILNERVTLLAIENQKLHEEMLNLQHIYSESTQENISLQSQLQSATALVQTAKSQMEQYKARAQRMLQERGELVALKESNESEDSSALQNYNEELKQQLEFQQSRNMEQEANLKKMSQEISFLQQEIVSRRNHLQESNKQLQESLATEKKDRSIAEEDYRAQTYELKSTRTKILQQTDLIESQQNEIAQLKRVLQQKNTNIVNEEVDMRIKSLTDTLMIKQTTLERVTTERNALKLLLEKLENEYHRNLSQLEKNQVCVVNVNDTDDVKSQVPQFMKVSPLDAGVTRRVKHAYSTVDAISVRTGVFLRRYPLMRVFVFCYMILLQLWAFVILFYYAPSGR